MKTSEAARGAGLVDEARRSGALLDQLITEQTALSMDGAYAIQEQLTELRCRRGERRVGWKLGFTSAAMRAQIGVVEANVGSLTDAMVLSDGADIVTCSFSTGSSRRSRSSSVERCPRGPRSRRSTLRSLQPTHAWR